MGELTDIIQILKINDGNPDLLPTTVVILSIIYIVYATIVIPYSSRRMKRLQRLADRISQKNTRTKKHEN